jgi:hypothetical protein
LANPLKSLQLVAIFKQTVFPARHDHYWYYAWTISLKGIGTMLSKHSMSNGSERTYRNLWVLEAAMMKLMLRVGEQDSSEKGAKCAESNASN